MARKSIKGYAEKNYYDNTRFSGGIVATNDPLNEGYFKHLVNFDISDTGQSLIPRKGFLTTTFKKGDETYVFNNDHIYFYDESLGKYIFFDNNKGYVCDFDLEEKFLTNIVEITNIDRSDIDALSYRVNINNTYGNKAIRIVDEYNVVSYILKVSLVFTSVNHKKQIKPYWLKLFYRENASEYAGVSYEADTLVISYLDTTQVVDYVVDPNYRNLASGASIIPNPMQVLYTDASVVPSDHYDRFPMIYVKGSDGKYLINEIKSTDINKDGFTIVPNFYIDNTDTDNYIWLYSYEITSTKYADTLLDTKVMYKSPLYNISNNTYYMGITYTLSELYSVQNREWSKVYDYIYDTTLIEAYNNKSTEYIEYIQAVNSSIYSVYSDVPEYIIYVVPLITNKASGYHINLTSTEYLGPCGFSTHFSETELYDYNGADSLGPVTTGADAHNAKVKEGTLISSKYTIYNSECNSVLYQQSTTVSALLDYIKNKEGIGVYVVPAYSEKEPTHLYEKNNTRLLSNIQAWEEPPLTMSEFASKYSDVYNNLSKAFSIAVVSLPYIARTHVYATKFNDIHSIGKQLFPEITDTHNNVGAIKDYYISYTLKEINRTYDINAYYNSYTYSYSGNYYTPYTESKQIELITYNLTEYYKDPSINLFSSLFFYNIEDLQYTNYLFGRPYDICKIYDFSSNLFSLNNNVLQSVCNKDNDLYKYLLDNKYFEQGINITFYLLKITMYNNYVKGFLSPAEVLTTYPKLYNTRTLITTTNKPSTYIEQLIEDPKIIANAKNAVAYDSLLGSHLVLYTGNKVYISEPGRQYYFTQFNKFEYPEPVVKVIQYKEILLVFTAQNLYAIHLEEVTKQVENGTNEDGSTKYIQEVSYEFRSHAVLYNLMVNEKYADAIQVYNQMVLFYSADGQMFLIKPTAAITSDTRFNIQYFNKSANDILLNYKEYIQRRLQDYGLDDTVDNVDIKVLANINYIKIFYSTDKITYILVYDVNNNRYFVYDTVAFSNIKYLHYIPSGELYITERDSNLYFTVPYTDTNMVDNNVDISFYDYFSPYEINAEIDTGVINLNNHLKKRFKDLHVIYKNLNANDVSFSLETYVDDVPIITYINSTFEVRNVSSFDTLVVVDNNNVVQLIRPEDQLIDNTALFSFIDYTSNKIITHKTNIVSKGKTIRIKMKYRSKGKYKIQGFGLIYKEHTV